MHDWQIRSARSIFFYFWIYRRPILRGYRMLISLGWKFLFFFFRGLINAFHEYEWIEIMDKYELNVGNLIKKKKKLIFAGNIPSIEFCWYNILEDKNERKMAIID